MNIQAVHNTLVEFLPYQLQGIEWLAVVLSAICIGISKTGISGATTIMLPFMAMIFGAKESTGVVLPLLCLADVIAVIYYRRAADWRCIIRLLPWTIVGFVIALFVDSIVNERYFKYLMAFCILLGVVVMFWNDRRGKNAALPSGIAFSASAGALGGFSTMIGNAAGPVMSVYLLSMRLPKTTLVGTTAWFFMLVNYMKLPLQFLVWHNVTTAGLKLALILIPAIFVGALLGILLVKKSSEKVYRILVYIMTIVSALLLLIRGQRLC